MTTPLHPPPDPDPIIAVPIARPRARGSRWIERTVYGGLAGAITMTVVIGFWRTFYARRWYPEWAAAHAAPEAIFYVHGIAFTAWLVLLLMQTSLVAAGRVHLHRRLGWAGAALAVTMVALGAAASLVAAGRPTGFFNVQMPPLQFLVVPLTVLGLFAVFVTLGALGRRDPQSHKRYMILASIALIEAGVGRWRFEYLTRPSPVPGWGWIELSVDLFLVPLIVWDLGSRGRLHPVTLWGGLAIILSQPLRIMLAETGPWMTFARWAVGLM